MPNHIHLIAVPKTKDGLNLAIGEADDTHGRSILVKDDILVKTKPAGNSQQTLENVIGL